MKDNIIGVVGGSIAIIVGFVCFFRAKTRYKEAVKEYDPNKWIYRWWPGASHPGKEKSYVFQERAIGIFFVLGGLVGLVSTLIKIYKAP